MNDREPARKDLPEFLNRLRQSDGLRGKGHSMHGGPLPVALVERVRFGTNGVATRSLAGPVDRVAEKRDVVPRFPFHDVRIVFGGGSPTAVTPVLARPS